MASPATSRASKAIVPSVAFGEAMPALMRERRSLMRWGVALVSRYKAVVPADAAAAPAADAYRRAPEQETSAALAKPGVIGSAKREGFTFLGRFAFLGFVSWIPRDAWVDEHGTTRLSARRGVAGGIEGTMSSYYLATLFDDGSVITTWSVSPAPVPSSHRWQCRGGTENLAATHASHLGAIAKHAADTPARPLRVESLADFVVAAKYVDVYVVSDGPAASLLVTRVLVWGAMLAAIVAAVGWLAHRGGGAP